VVSPYHHLICTGLDLANSYNQLMMSDHTSRKTESQSELISDHQDKRGVISVINDGIANLALKLSRKAQIGP
jgi:hypothetical protein